jgi:hypothetical protein
MAQFRAELNKMLYEFFGIELKLGSQFHQKPYFECCDGIPYPQGFKAPDLASSVGVDEKKNMGTH